MKKIKLLVVTPYSSDANSFWRCVGPLTYLDKNSKNSKEDYEIEATLLDQRMPVNWVEVIQYDVIFMHRPCRQDDIIIMQIAYNLNVPVWVDFDDWLFGIPGWNPNAAAYLNPSTQNHMALAIACADVVSVSTVELYNLYSQVNENVVIVPNSYRSDLFTYRDELPARKNYLIWRGSNTHDGDLLSVKDGFKGIKHKMIFLGSPSWLLLSSLKKDAYEVKHSADVILYFKYLCELAPKVMVFPLVDCLFNRCKSNIAYIEALHAGAICVAPDMPEWRHPGVITYPPHDSQKFAAAVDYAMSLDESEHQNLVDDAFAHMKDALDISKTDHIRHQIMSHLMHGVVKKSPFDQSLGMKALAVFKAKENRNGADASAEKAGELGLT